MFPPKPVRSGFPAGQGFVPDQHSLYSEDPIMVYVRTAGLRSFALLALFLAATFQAPCAKAQYEYEWGKALLEDLRFEDMAETVFADLASRSSNDEKNQGRLGLALLKRSAAQRTDDIGLRAKLNDEAIKILESVAKSIDESSTEYWDTQFSLADTLQEVANEGIDLVSKGLVPADKVADLIKTNLNRLDKAEYIYTNAKDKFADAKEGSDEKTIQGRATLNHFVLQLRRAWLTGTDPKKRADPDRLNRLNDLREELEEFAGVNDGQVYGIYGYYWLAQTMAELSRSSSETKPEEIADYYFYVIDSIVYTPEQFAANGRSFIPAEAGLLSLAQSTYWKLLEFENGHGWTGLVITHGEKMRADFKACKYDFAIGGDLALIELANAYQNEGRSGEALEIAATISKKGGYQGQQADKLMSLIINTAVSKAGFDPRLLMAGANGARIAAGKNPAKYHEAIELYRGVLQNLHKVEDVVERNDLGRQAGYRIGQALDRLGRDFESAIAFESTYRRFNNTQFRVDPKLNNKVFRYWRSMLSQFQRAAGGQAFAKDLREKADRYLVNNPPKGKGTGDSLQLAWNQAEKLRRQKSWEEAKGAYAKIASKPSEYQERATVKAAVISVQILGANRATATADQWVAAAKAFEDYKKYTDSNVESDPTRLSARKGALIEADLQISGALSRAADLEKDVTKKEALYRRVLAVTDGFGKRTRDENAGQYVRFNRFKALVAVGEAEAAEAIFDEMVKTDPKHRNVPSAALQIYQLLRDSAATMTTLSDEGRKKQRATMQRAGEAYRIWLFAKQPRKPGNWTVGYKIFYEAEQWDPAYEILRAAMKKFSGQRGKEKAMGIFRRRLARTLLEKAKFSFRQGRKEESEELFKEASVIYVELVSAPKKPRSVLAEAAEIFGGFVTGPDQRGRYAHFPGTSEFKDAYDIWKKLAQWSNKAGSTPAKEAANALLRPKAEFYKLLMALKIAQANKDTRSLKKLKKFVESTFQKGGPDNPPGGAKWSKQWQWLRSQL